MHSCDGSMHVKGSSFAVLIYNKLMSLQPLGVSGGPGGDGAAETLKTYSIVGLLLVTLVIMML